jgi:hypothetical protein
MPVEDIDFLLNNSEKDAYLFFVDSKSRNKDVFPTSSEYEIYFSEPFSNVYGIEVMDAMVPSTMYTLDVWNRLFKYTMVYLGFHTTDEQLSIYFARFCSFSKTFVNLTQENTKINHMVVVRKDLFNSPISYLSEDTGFYVCENTITYVPFSMYLRFTTNSPIPANTFMISSLNVGLDKTDFYYILLQNALESGEYIAQFEEGTDRLIIETLNINNISTDDYYDIVRITPNPVYGMNGNIANLSVLFQLSSIYYMFEEGNYDISTFAQTINAMFTVAMSYMIDTDVKVSDPYGILSQDVPFVTKTSIDGTFDKQTKFKFTLNNVYSRLFIDLTRSTCKSEIGFSTYTTQKGKESQYTRIPWWPNNENIVSCLPSKILIPPGIVNLTGIRYVLLRCPEIENHLYNSFSYSRNCPGIGLFKLGSVNQITNVRLDFVHFIKRPFHPIGKLKKITLRFETTAGDLYDFKGVDHNMLLSVKFYVPKSNVPRDQYLLNPNYNPNFLEYMIKRMDINRQEEDALYKTQLQDDNRVEMLLEEQNLWDYSSDEEDDDGSEINI